MIYSDKDIQSKLSLAQKIGFYTNSFQNQVIEKHTFYRNRVKNNSLVKKLMYIL